MTISDGWLTTHTHTHTYVHLPCIANIEVKTEMTEASEVSLGDCSVAGDGARERRWGGEERKANRDGQRVRERGEGGKQLRK